MMFELHVLRAILAVERGDTTPEEILAGSRLSVMIPPLPSALRLLSFRMLPTAYLPTDL